VGKHTLSGIDRHWDGLQVWCVLLTDKVPFRMHWPAYCGLHINCKSLPALPFRCIDNFLLGTFWCPCSYIFGKHLVAHKWVGFESCNQNSGVMSQTLIWFVRNLWFWSKILTLFSADVFSFLEVEFVSVLCMNSCEYPGNESTRYTTAWCQWSWWRTQGMLYSSPGSSYW